MAGEFTLGINPLKKFTSFSTYFIVKLGLNYSTDGGKAGYEDATLILDSRGGGDDNGSPTLTVNSFEIDHNFNGSEAKITIGLDSTLIIFERGGCSYLQKLGTVMAELGLTTTASAILWVGVGIVGWESEGTGYKQTAVSEKWFPHTIKSIDMTMRNSGSEYSHWLKGSAYEKSHAMANNHLNIKETVGNTMQDHLDDLMRNANTEIIKAKELNTNGSASNVAFKDVSYSIYVDPRLNATAPVEVNTTAYDTGGSKHISSGGRNGSTTIISHIREIIKRSPKFLDDLTTKKYDYKIIARSIKTTNTSEAIEYRIIPYATDPINDKATPLIGLNYFYGGINEDILEFSFELNGSFELIRQNIISNTLEDISGDPSRTPAQIRKNVEASKTPTIPESIRSEDTAKTAVTTQDHNTAAGVEIPPKPFKTGFGNDMNRNSSKAWNSHSTALEATIGRQLVSNAVTIRGNPLLILDEATVAEYNLEGAASLVIFNIGTPTPEFQSSSPQGVDGETFIYSGNYLLRGVKSIFGAGGTFTQELRMTWISASN